MLGAASRVVELVGGPPAEAAAAAGAAR